MGKTRIRRVCALLLGAAVALAGFGVRAEEPTEEEVQGIVLRLQEEEPLEMLKLDEELPEAIAVSGLADDSLPARSAILIDQAQGTVLYEKNADEALPPASITKVMTLLLAMEALEDGRINLDDMVSASEYACSMGGSQIWLKPGEQMSVDDLLKAVAISSANDASVAIAEHIAGTNDAFIDMMNRRAQDLGMENTHFLNCNGLDEAGHLTTARDIAIMSRELMKHPRIRDYSTIWMDTLRGGETELVNTNRLVRFYGGTTGLKTGTTNGAGSCLSATAERDTLGLVAVVMGCATSDDRFGSARSLLDYGFANFTSAEAPSIDEQLAPVPVLRGVEEQVGITYTPPGSFVVNKQSKDAISQEITLVPDVEAPVYEGQILGKVEVLIDGVVVTSYDLKADAAVERITVPKAFRKLLDSVLRLKDSEEAVPEASGEAEAAPEPAVSEVQ
ncbi:D-alanyl-D-alanine carboxypeptidase [Ruminococcaceae bacterium OttesenSCG-928-L11]|nr:D-alanyl-D-alanine carboxypeptidase [Ruminococcaceae bacterium OttesenSCG-928-L11]